MTDRAALLDALLADPAKCREIAPDDAADLLIALAPVQRALEIAVVRTVARSVAPAASSIARLLTLAEAAERSRKSARWLRDHWRASGIVVVRKGRSLLFPEPEFDRWLRRT